MLVYPVPDFAKGKVIVFSSERFSCDGKEWDFSLGNPSLVDYLSSLWKCLSLGKRPVSVLKQIHSSRVLFLDNDAGYGKMEGDGLITPSKNLVIGVLTADCYPIVFFDFELNFVSVVHAGWRGSKAGIVGSAIKKFKSLGIKPENLVSIVGCGIGKCCYEVGSDFLVNFPEKYFEQKGDSYFFDLKRFLIDEISSFGVNVYYTDKRCSSCSMECYSYRRDKTEKRMLTGVFFV